MTHTRAATSIATGKNTSVSKLRIAAANTATLTTNERNAALRSERPLVQSRSACTPEGYAFAAVVDAPWYGADKTHRSPLPLANVGCERRKEMRRQDTASRI